MYRLLVQLSILILVSTACSWAAYKYAWHSFWAAHVRGDEGVVYEPIEDHILYIGIISPPGNFLQRHEARNQWLLELKSMSSGGQVKAEFLIGQVPIQGNNISETKEVVASESEKKMERDLQDEEKLYNDIVRIPVVEAPLFQTHETFWLLSNAVSWKARFALQTTDAQVIDVKTALSSLEQHTLVDPPIYFGRDFDPDDALEADGKKTWFFDRECFGISGELAHNIVKSHLRHTMAFPTYGSSNAAVNVAKWVKYEDDERKKYGLPRVEHLWVPKLSKKIEVSTTPSPWAVPSVPASPGATVHPQ